MKLKKSTVGCSVEFRISSLKQWFDGTFIGKSERSLDADGDTCNYAMLDTVGKTLIYKHLDEKLEWIRKCNDLQIRNQDVYCMSWNEWHRDGILKRNNNDTLDVPFEFGKGGFWGNVVELGGHFCNIENQKVICSNNIFWIRPLKFKNNDDVILDLN